ncbi:hypothetical protein DPMN_074688 [Dreissena polymorpha]|uniref:Uncharacterized protein n=1 Tax=Dreissena polymorpha TaxID=45954 RepID=A0A9D3YFG9_DREPO|nr:hypothetical protein DPMN_074688 [Dreissena polymorpha]
MGMVSTLQQEVSWLNHQSGSKVLSQDLSKVTDNWFVQGNRLENISGGPRFSIKSSEHNYD